jgi:hypothetical protein
MRTKKTNILRIASSSIVKESHLGLSRVRAWLTRILLLPQGARREVISAGIVMFSLEESLGGNLGSTISIGPARSRCSKPAIQGARLSV